jgi:hypothetical protein
MESNGDTVIKKDLPVNLVCADATTDKGGGNEKAVWFLFIAPLLHETETILSFWF